MVGKHWLTRLWDGFAMRPQTSFRRRRLAKTCPAAQIQLLEHRCLLAETIVDTQLVGSVPSNISLVDTAVYRQTYDDIALTQDAIRPGQSTGQQGSLIVDSHGYAAVAFDANVRIWIGNPPGSPQGAGTIGGDGVSFGYGDLSGHSFGESGQTSRAGLWISIDTFEGSSSHGAIKVFYRASPAATLYQVDSVLYTGNARTELAPGGGHILNVSVNEFGILTYKYPTMATSRSVNLGSTWNPQPHWRFGCGSRTGTATDDNVIDFLQIYDNNNTPTDIALSNSSVNENQPSASVGFLSTTDPGNVGGFDGVTYALVDGTGSVHNPLFAIVGNQLIVKSTTNLNYEASNQLSVRIQTKDKGGRTREEIFAITVNDLNEPPTALGLSNFSVPENQPGGTTIGNLSTHDPDAGNAFTYSLVGGAGSTDNGSFQIVGNQLQTAAPFNFEDKNSYSVRVHTADQGGLWFEQAFTLIVADVNEAPTALALSNNSVAENQPSGTTVGTLSSTDPDAGNMFTYSLVSGDGSTDNNEFQIVGDQLQTAANFDFEQKRNYLIRVRSTDQNGLLTEKAIGLVVSDVNEAPIAVAFVNTINSLPENTNTVSRVKLADIVVVDDASGTNTLTLTGDDAAAFEIFNGGLCVIAGTILDFETKAIYEVMVHVDDTSVGDAPDASISFTLNLTNANDAPVIAGTSTNQPVNDTATISPFSALTVSDPDNQNLLARVTILNGVVRGDFTADSAVDWTRTVTGNNIIYSQFFAPASNNDAIVQSAIRTLVFQPRTNVLKPNTTELTDFAVFIGDGVANTTNTATRVITISVNDAPVFGSTGASATVNDNATVSPFNTLLVTDVDHQEMLISVTILNGKFRGDFTNANSGTGWTVRYTTGNNITYKRYFSPGPNVGATVQAAFRDLVFQPRRNAIKPGTTEATDFQVTISDGVAPAVLGTGTRVTTTSMNDAGTIGGAVANQALNDNQTKAVFSSLTITDPDTQDLFVRVTIAGGTAKGDFSPTSAAGWTRKTSGTNILYERFFAAATNNGMIAQTAVRALVFQPRNNVLVGTTETTSFMVFVNDGLVNVTNSTTSVITTGVAPRFAAGNSTMPHRILDGDTTTAVLASVGKPRAMPFALSLEKPRRGQHSQGVTS